MIYKIYDCEDISTYIIDKKVSHTMYIMHSRQTIEYSILYWSVTVRNYWETILCNMLLWDVYF